MNPQTIIFNRSAALGTTWQPEITHPRRDAIIHAIKTYDFLMDCNCDVSAEEFSKLIASYTDHQHGQECARLIGELKPKTGAEIVRDEMKASGMTELTTEELDELLGELGYVIDRDLTFDYANTSNANSYLARSVYIKEVDSGMSFANVDARKDTNLTKLQQLREGCFVCHANRIWEL